MQVFDVDTQKEVNIDFNEIDKITLYLKSEDRKIMDIEYINESNSVNARIDVSSEKDFDSFYNILKNDMFNKGE